MKEKTLCWKCKNSVKCQWSRGKPIEGWDAEPITIKNDDGTKIRTFFVNDCPQFEQDTLIRVSYREITEMIGDGKISDIRSFSRTNEKLKKLGYELIIHPSDGNPYIKKL